MLFLDLTHPEDGVLIPGSLRTQVRQGSIDEDECPNYVHHFYDPKTGQNTTLLPPQLFTCDRPPGFVQQTAPARARDFWASAISKYRAGDRANAFLDLGHVFHLLQDMSSPAHVHNDVHVEASVRSDCQDGDDFENWGWSPNCTLTHTSFDHIYDYIQDDFTWALKAKLLSGLQKIFKNQPQIASPVAGGGNAAYYFVHALANKVYDFTTFQVTLTDTLDSNDRGGGELKRMFSSLEETTVPAAWWIEDIGYSQGQCSGIASTFNQAWWMMSCTTEAYCGPWYAPNSVYCVAGLAYIENTGGDSGTTSEIPDNLFPAVYEKDWFQSKYGSFSNNTSSNRNTMLRIYGDVLYPAAVAYGAGLLQAFLDDAIMPKPITQKPSQLAPLNAQLNGQVRPLGEFATAWFEWGQSTNYGTATPLQDAGTGQGPTNLNARIEGLSPDAVYYCRMVSSNRFGIRYGTNQTFQTPALFTGNAPNAWQITDHSTTSTLNYTTNLTQPHQQAATNSGWRYSINMRMVDDFGGTKTMTFFYQTSANRRFLIWWDLDSEGNLTAELEGLAPQVVATNGLGSTLYHTHEIRYTNNMATYLFEGKTIGTWPGVSLSLQPSGQVFWGSGSSAGMGQMNVHDVQFEIATIGAVASYHAGTAGNPAVAPNPVTQGWTATPASPPLPNAFTPVSPDFEPYMPLVETLPASDVLSETVQLQGRVDPRGYLARGWFEWGEQPNYGNATPPVGLSDGFGWSNVSENLSGLSSGQTYHFRFVASNDFVVVYGGDQTFVTGRQVVITSIDMPLPEWFRLRFVGAPGTEYEVERSTDLSAWTTLGQGNEVSQGVFEFTDVALPPAYAYYRVRSLPASP